MHMVERKIILFLRSFVFITRAFISLRVVFNHVKSVTVSIDTLTVI